MRATEAFRDQVQAAWGNLAAVGEAGMNEIFRHGDELGLDFDDQVSYAMQIGILVGVTKEDSPEVFINAFESGILND